jgi:2-phosphosulfolactate phosphatase
MPAYYDQADWPARFEWGLAGVQRLGPAADVLVIVVVLSSTTVMSLAAERDALVLPYRWQDASAIDYARQHDSQLAAHRAEVSAERPYSLSPPTWLSVPAGTHVVLPSPNGANLAFAARDAGAVVLAGCLRNAEAVARAAQQLGQRILVIAAGERWDDADARSLRPALEDLLGAGAILAALPPAARAPEAAAAVAAFDALRDTLPATLDACSSGRQLRERGYAQDVAIAAQLNVSTAVPILRADAFERWPG